MLTTPRSLKSIALAAISVATLAGSQAHAIPLLAENADTRYKSNIALAIYPDSEDVNKFYYFPNMTELAKDDTNSPEFSLSYTGIDAHSPDAEGLMTATFHLVSDANQIEAINEFLKEHPGAGVAVMPVAASILTTGVSAPQAGTGFTQAGPGAPPVNPAPMMNIFKALDLPPYGGLPDSYVGFSAELSASGVQLLRAQIAGNSAHGLMACYEIEGFGPSMDATVHIAWSQVYDYMKVQASGGWAWFHADVQRVVETLHTKGIIQFTINGGNATQQDYIYKITDMVIEKFFTATLNAAPGSDGQSIFDSTPLHVGLNSVHKEDVKDFDGTWTIRDLVKLHTCVDMNLHQVAPWASTKIVDADKL